MPAASTRSPSILNRADRSTERNVLDAIAETDAELAEEIRQMLFAFEDIVELDDRGDPALLREVDQKDLALALRGVSEEVATTHALATCPQRGAEMLREEMETSRRSAGASSRRPRAASSPPCAASRTPGRS